MLTRVAFLSALRPLRYCLWVQEGDQLDGVDVGGVGGGQEAFSATEIACLVGLVALLLVVMGERERRLRARRRREMGDGHDGGAET